MADGRYVSPTPSLLGAEPASYGTLAPLSDDEERGFRFVNSLTQAQRAAAVIWHRPPPDLATRIVPRIGDVERPDPVFPPEPEYVINADERDILSYVRNSPKGLPAPAMSKQQVNDLTTIIEAFAARLPPEVAAAQLRNIKRHGLENLTFAWAGGTAPGGRHYFRIQGPVLLIEHDNTQANGAHIHSVWRNPADDFGDDILAAHYRQHHASGRREDQNRSARTASGSSGPQSLLSGACPRRQSLAALRTEARPGDGMVPGDRVRPGKRLRLATLPNPTC